MSYIVHVLTVILVIGAIRFFCQEIAAKKETNSCASAVCLIFASEKAKLNRHAKYKGYDNKLVLTHKGNKMKQKQGHITDLRNSSDPCAKWHLSPKVQDPFAKFSQSFVLKLFD